MSEIEAAAADTLSGLFRRQKPAHARPPGSPCANCQTTLQGPWCHACGQMADDFHRSVRHLLMEGVEGLLHFDGRLWQTLPRLFLRPAILTKSYIDGQRAPQIPPFRLFLVVVLLVFFSAHASGHSFFGLTPDPAKTSERKGEIPKLDVTLAGAKPDKAASLWLQHRLTKAMESPEQLSLIMEAWAHRLAILMLPISAALLSLLFLFKRRFYVFDHLIFSMHSLSFAGVVLSAFFLLSPVIRGWADILLWALPVHLFVHMRGVYGVGVFGALLRMALLFVGSLLGFAFIMVLLVGVGLNALGH